MKKPIVNNTVSGGIQNIRPIVTFAMIRSRTVELAVMAGRSPIEIRQCDYERAKRELTGETNDDRQQAAIHP